MINNPDDPKKIRLEGKTSDIPKLPREGVANGSTFWDFERQVLLTFSEDDHDWI